MPRCPHFVLALALFQQDSYDDVAENLVGSLGGMDRAVPNKSSFTRARQQLGAAPLEGCLPACGGSDRPAHREVGLLARDESRRGRRIPSGCPRQRGNTFHLRRGGGQLPSSREPAEDARRYPLTDDERAAVDDRQAALDQLLERLTGVPTPAGLTPRQVGVPATATLLPIVDVKQGKPAGS